MADIGIVIPCHNVEAYVGDAIASLQFERNLIAEIVCVDDGSTDGTVAAINDAAGEYGVPITILTGEGRGAGAARNIGLAALESVFCQFLDADDVLLPGKLAHQRSLLMENGAGIVAGAYRLEPQDDKPRTVTVERDMWRGLITSRLGATSSMLFRTETVRAVDGWSEDLASSQEYDLLFRIVSAGIGLTTDDEVLTVKRERPDAISSSDPVARWSRFVSLRAGVLTYLDDSGQLTDELTRVGHQTVFRAIQKIAPHDLGLASKLVDSELPPSFRPDGASVAARLYRLLYSSFGFTSAQWIRQMLEPRQ